MSGSSTPLPRPLFGHSELFRSPSPWVSLGRQAVALVLGIAFVIGSALAIGSVPAVAQPGPVITDDRSILDTIPLDSITRDDMAMDGVDMDGVTLDGIVVDKESGDPLEDAHVFLAGSMRGTTTDAEGRFELRDVRKGAQRLYASMLGYEPQFFDLFLQTDTTYTFAFRLPPQVIERPGIVVEAERDPGWHKRLARFETLFLGSSEWADSCTIQNPEALRFESKWWGKFTARAVEPLVVINRALGYRVQYFLDEFEASGGVIRWDGEPLFAPLDPANPSEADRWRANRQQAYYGSLRHFLRALLQDRVREEEFSMYRLPRAGMFRSVGQADRFLATRDAILSVDEDSVYHLNFRGRLEVIYKGESESPAYTTWLRESRRTRGVQTSQIELNDPPVRVDRDGKIVEPYGATVYRYFAFERLAELLPIDYTPEQVSALVGTRSTSPDIFKPLPAPDLDRLGIEVPGDASSAPPAHETVSHGSTPRERSTSPGPDLPRP